MLGEASVLCVGDFSSEPRMGISPLSFDPSPWRASTGELREKCKKVSCASK